MKDLHETAEWKLGTVMDESESIQWVSGPEHLTSVQKRVMGILMLLMLAVTVGNMFIDDGLPLLAKLSFLLPMALIGGAILWFSKRNNGMARYVVTDRQVIVITPRLLGYANAFLVRYPLGPKSTIEIDTDLTGSNIGKLTIKSPDHFKNPDKPRQQMILNALSDPDGAKRAIGHIIKHLI